MDDLTTFGEWVLNVCFPGPARWTLNENGMRDFCGAQRSSDGRTYLVGMLMSGSLPAAPVRAFLTDQGLGARL